MSLSRVQTAAARCLPALGAAALLGACGTGTKIPPVAARDTGPAADTGPGCGVVAIVLDVVVDGVTGAPLGLDASATGTAGTLELGWRPCLPDGDGAEGQGRFAHDGAGALRLDLGGHRLDGSGRLLVETTVWHNDHDIVFVDGARVGGRGGTAAPALSVDGAADPALSFSAQLSVDGQLAADALPTGLEVDPAAAHTLTVDGGGDVLSLAVIGSR